MVMAVRVPLAKPDSSVFYTGDMVRALNEAEERPIKYETVYGELLVSPAPRVMHQVVVDRLAFALKLYALGEPAAAGSVSSGLSDHSFQRPDVLVQPDVWAVRLEELRTLRWDRLTGMLLTAEVSSPSSRRADRFTKRRLYQQERVPLYWCVDVDRAHVEVWRPDDQFPHTETERLVWHPEGAGAPFELALSELFAPL